MSEIKYYVAKYIRASHADDQEGESNTIGNQRRILDSFIESQPDMEAVSERVDDGFSGIIFDRPAFKEMMADIQAGKVNCVIVKDLSRLGRERIEIGRYLRSIFPAYGVRLIALNDNIDTLKDSGDDLVVSVKSIINDAYARDISVKTRSALRAKRENGDFVGNFTIYGYIRAEDNKNQLVPDEYAAAIVRDIFRMKLEGMSAAKIAEMLNALGVLSPLAYKRDRGLPHPTGGYTDKTDAKWSPTTILRILQDETYTGVLLQGRQGTLNYKIKNLIDKPSCEWVRVEDAHEAIIHRLDYDFVQRIMRLDTRTAPGGGKVYLFSGILICGCCGARMTRKAVPYNGRKYHYYYCPTTKKRGCTSAASLKESDLMDCVLESVRAHIGSVASLDAVLRGSDRQAAIDRLAAQYMAQMDEIERQLFQFRGFKSSLYENFVKGLLSKDDYMAYKADYTKEEARLRGAAETLRQHLDDVQSGKGERLRWTEYFRHFENLTELDRRTVANLIQSIRVVNKTELEITFNYQAEYDIALALLQEGVA